MDLSAFDSMPLMGILRGIERAAIAPLAEAAAAAGLKAVEITMNTGGAPELISQMARAAQGRFDVGAGTVLTANDLKRALDAGASFVVLPVAVPEVVEYCAKNSIPVFPGALSPQEIYEAWRMGATMVKVFPAKFFGPAYLREIKGPFAEIKLLACGGVSTANIGDFFSAGASAAAFGASVFKPDEIRAGRFADIGSRIADLVRAYRAYASCQRKGSAEHVRTET
ncbi:MAG: bifunctional 4-hydroxy-2-oxoglutarate aldolase/2-dehydro-3-deoxy-phosphogluconate aldolase [Candidatus Omnitrophota bacterium]